MTTTHVPLQEWGNNMEWDLRERPISTTWRRYWIASHRHNAQHHQDRTHNTPNQQDRIPLQHVQRSTRRTDPRRRYIFGRGKHSRRGPRKENVFLLHTCCRLWKKSIRKKEQRILPTGQSGKALRNNLRGCTSNHLSGR